jgi:hypothetical protein
MFDKRPVLKELMEASTEQIFTKQKEYWGGNPNANGM